MIREGTFKNNRQYLHKDYNTANKMKVILNYLSKKGVCMWQRYMKLKKAKEK